MALLEVRDLRTYFQTAAGPARAVDGVSFDLEAGEVLGIVGESGSGKSVTSLSILGLVPQPPGRIQPGSSVRFKGEELLGAPEERMRRIRGNDIAMIFQEPMTSLNPVFTVGDQIAESLRHPPRGLEARGARRGRSSCCELVGIPDPARALDDYPHQLSGGMRQRVMIAMALACEPEAADRRRADDRARRDDPGADPRAARRAADASSAWRCCSSPTTSASSPRSATASS